MDILKSIFFGLVQGVTEFLPVSSSGHLAILQNIFGLDQPALLYDVLLHVGTLAAVFVMFWKDICAVIVSIFTIIGKIFTGRFRWKTLEAPERLTVLLVIGTLPLIPVVLIQSKVELIMGYTRIIGALLLLNALMLFLSDKIRPGKQDARDASPVGALCVGLFQMIATLPGISRSGATIAGGLFMGFDREFAFRFSFLLSIPAVLGATLVSTLQIAKDSGGEALTAAVAAPYIIGALTAAIVGIGAISLLRLVMKRKSFFIFAIYCALAGLAAVIFG